MSGAEPRRRRPRRYALIGLGFLDELPSMPVHAQLTLCWLLTSPLRRSVPGVVPIGKAGLAESLGWGLPVVNRAIASLEAARIAVVSQRPPLIFVPLAIVHDPPANPNVLKAWAADLRELPSDCDIVQQIRTVIADVLDGEMLSQWFTLNGFPNGSANGSPNGSGNRMANPATSHQPPVPATSTGHQPPAAVSVSEAGHQPPPPAPVDVAAAEARLVIWNRTGRPFVAAGLKTLSADDRMRLVAMPVERLAALVEHLQASFFARDEDVKARPTLARLLQRPDLQERLMSGELHSGNASVFRCGLCGLTHQAIDDCPPKCRGCHQRHAVRDRCRHLEILEADEAHRAQVEAYAVEHGVTPEEAEHVLQKQRLESMRERLGFRARSAPDRASALNPEGIEHVEP